MHDPGLASAPHGADRRREENSRTSSYSTAKKAMVKRTRIDIADEGVVDTSSDLIAQVRDEPPAIISRPPLQRPPGGDTGVRIGLEAIRALLVRKEKLAARVEERNVTE